MARLAFLYPGKDSDKLKNPEYFRALENVIRSVARADTSFEIRGLRDPLPEQSEMAYWYVHPKVWSSMIATAKRAEKEGFDAVVIGDFGGTDAEYAIKEVLDIPVAGLGESSFLLAQMLGQNFSILTYNNKVAAWVDRLVRDYQVEARCVSVRPANITLQEALSRSSENVIRRKMLIQAKKAIAEDRAEVVINGSAGLVGLADYLRKQVNAPVVDAVESGIKIAEMLTDFKRTKNLYQSKVACYEPSPNAGRVIDEFL